MIKYIYAQIKEAAFSMNLWRDTSNPLHIKKQLCNNNTNTTTTNNNNKKKKKKKKKKMKNSSSAFISLIKYISEVTDSINILLKSIKLQECARIKHYYYKNT